MMDIATKQYETLIAKAFRGGIGLQINRPAAKNSINTTLIKELTQALNAVEHDPDIKIVLLEGLPDHFCTGMDFEAISEQGADAFVGADPNDYYNLLKHFSGCSKVIVAKVAGAVNAGGIGLIAASDIVIASESATFGLSEALFGLLPACVMPFLIRRVGYQKAQWMTLMTQGCNAQKAERIGLVDEVAPDLNDATRRTLLRLSRLEPATVKNLKDYMGQLWIMDEQTQKLAVDKIASLIQSEKVQSNISNFINKGIFPWDK